MRRLPAILVTLIQTAVSLPLLTVAVRAQNQAPPNYLQIFREVVKPGRGVPHGELEAAWSQAFGRAKVPLYTVAMTTIFGPSEVWWLQGMDSIAQFDEINKAVEAAPKLRSEIDRYAAADAANISGSTSVLARYLPDLSNPADVDVAAMRVWEVLIFQVRSGYEKNFAEAAKLYKTTLGQAKLNLPWATYAVMAGMPGPTYLVFVPHRALAEIDPSTGTGAEIEKAFNEAAQTRLDSLARGYSSTEELVFAVSPEMSNPAPELIARDPKFWAPKPKVKKTTASAPPQ
jgi:hypothetical protein